MTKKAGLIKTVADGFANFVTGVGRANPKTRGHGYVPSTDSEAELAAVYESSTWFGKIVDIPADDATREWRVWRAEKPQIEDLEKAEKKLMLRAAVRQALIWARAYGGAVIIPIGLPGEMSTPLNMERVTKDSIKSLTVLHRFEIKANGRIRDPFSPFFGHPEYYTLTTEGREKRIHPSRVILFNGRETRSTFSKGEVWGRSIWAHMADSVLASDAGAAIIDTLMQESKVDVVRVQGMMNSMASADYEALLLKRWTLVNLLKSVSNTMLLDKDDEFEQKQINWQGLPEVIYTLLTIMSGAADIPLTRLLGTSAKGLNATGEGDMKNYYDSVKTKQELIITPMMTQLDEMLIRSALGDRPDAVWYEWEPLFQMSEKEEAEIDKLQAEAVDIYARTGLIPDRALAVLVQNRLIESSQWPGADVAYNAAEDELAIEEPEVDPDMNTVPNSQQTANDALPRTLYVRRDVKNAKQIIAHFKKQGFSSTLAASDMHVTIMFSRIPVDWMDMGEAWASELKVPAGGARIMEALGEGKRAKVMLFNSSELRWRHDEMKRKGASWDWPEYQPHITLSYDFDGDLEKVEPWQGEIVLGPEIFEEVDEDWQTGISEK